MIEGSPERFDVLAGEHRAHGLDGDGNHHRNGLAEFAAEIVDGQDAGLDVARVLAGFEQQQIGAAFDEAFGLIVEILAQLSKVMPPVTLMALVVGPMEPATKRGFAAVENSSAALRASSPARRLISCALSPRPYSARTSGVPPKELVSMMSEPASQILAMNVENDVGTGDHQILVAAFEMRPAEILGGEIGLLQHGAHGAIQDEDALAEQFAKGQALLDQISHVFTIIPRQMSERRATLGLCNVEVNGLTTRTRELLEAIKKAMHPPFCVFCRSQGLKPFVLSTVNVGAEAPTP